MSIWADEQGKEEYGPLDAISVSHMSARNGVLLLTARSIVRSWTEPAILLLIITNVVVLAIQSAPTLNSPRTGNGYFQGWEDAVLLVLFIVFT